MLKKMNVLKIPHIFDIFASYRQVTSRGITEALLPDT